MSDNNTTATSTTATSSTEEIIIWTSFCVGFTLLGFALATYDYIKRTRSTPTAKRKRRADKEQKQQLEEERKLTAVSVEPIAINDFMSEWRLRQRKKTLQYEFKKIERQQGVSPKVADAAKKPENVSKNIGSILPYEHSFVRMIPIGKSSAAYVNANWIEGFNNPRKYIAAQGPNVHGAEDFFEMIWQCNVKCVVMLNQVSEHGTERGIRYWRDGAIKGIPYGSFNIKVVEYTVHADFVVRQMELKHKGQTRPLHHFHLLSWSDMDRSNIVGFLEVRRRLSAIQNNAPLLVHCSNGSGRTGAFICADVNLDRIVANKPIDIFGFTVKIRRSRPMMINTNFQYQFVYELVANFITCGYTIVDGEHLSKTMQRLALKANNKNTGFEEELKNINAFTLPILIGDCAAGHRSENQWKSRDIMLQPAERSRPYLLTHEHAGGTDYINAVYVDGYFSTNQYLVTQWPLRSTVNDVWRLVYDHHVSVIVVLNDMGKGTRSYPRFWPAVTRQSTGFGPVAVELLREYELTSNIKCRIFQIRKIITDLAPKIIEAMKRYNIGEQIMKLLQSKRESEQGRIVVMLQTTCWPNRHKVPESTSSFLELVQASNDFYQELSRLEARATTCPILVLSKDGVSRAGCYCVVHASINRIAVENSVDIFRTTEIVKRNRPPLVDGISEYLFCYDSCLEFYNQSVREAGRDRATTSV